MEKIYYCHLREGFKRPMTVAYGIQNESNGMPSVVFSVAICNDHDQFCKKIGRMVSGGRLKAGKYQLLGEIDTKTFNHHEVVGSIIKMLK